MENADTQGAGTRKLLKAHVPTTGSETTTWSKPSQRSLWGSPSLPLTSPQVTHCMVPSLHGDHQLHFLSLTTGGCRGHKRTQCNSPWVNAPKTKRGFAASSVMLIVSGRGNGKHKNKTAPKETATWRPSHSCLENTLCSSHFQYPQRS